MEANELIRRLGLSPLGFEGGYYLETHRQAGALATEAGPRSPSTAIFYLLTPDTCSLMHRLRGPELYHFYLGDPVEQLMLREDGAEVVHLGPDLAAGQRVQHVVPGGVWQGSRLRPGGRYALMGTTMAPGFDLADFTLGRRDQLLPRCPPEHAALLTALTPTRLTTPHLELAAATRDLLHAELRGPTFLAAGLGAAVPERWWAAGAQVDLQAELEALGRDAAQRGWRSYYALERGGELLGRASLAGPPDAAGAVELACDPLPGGLRAEALDALAADALTRGARAVHGVGAGEGWAQAGFRFVEGRWTRGVAAPPSAPSPAPPDPTSTVRPYRPSDWPAVWRILAPIFEAGETYAVPRDLSEADARTYWTGGGKAVFVAEHPDLGVLGTYFLRPIGEGPTRHVCNCGYAVAAAARGRGLASTLCRHSQEEAVQRGFRGMQFGMVVSTNTGAVRLWRRLGFRVVGTLPGAFAHPRHGDVDAYVMFKPLGEEARPPARRPLIGVMGGGVASPEVEALAFALGEAIAEAGWVLLNGGRDAGVMAASARGAHHAGGLVVGVLPGATDAGASPHLDVALRTGLGDARNAVNVLSADVVVALPGGPGTLSEVALAVKAGRPVILLGWSLDGLFEPPAAVAAGSVAEAVAKVQDALRPRG
jgi:uncharacterized protein (TIGR00725 family)